MYSGLACVFHYHFSDFFMGNQSKCSRVDVPVNEHVPVNGHFLLK